MGLFKAFLFGLIMVTVSCHQGFSAREGAVGVGRATRQSVIVSFLFGALFFREKNLKAKAFDLALVLLGMIFLYIGSA